MKQQPRIQPQVSVAPSLSAGAAALAEGGALPTYEQLQKYARDLARTLAEREASGRQLRAYVQDLHRVIAERNGAREAAKAADATKKQFLSTMSHEFRTPLTAILGFSDYLAGRETDASKRDLVQRILRAGHRIDGLVERLLTLARLEFGGLAPDPALCDCVALVRAAAKRHEETARGKSLAFELREPDFPVMPIVIDGARFSQALEALVDNAVKFTAAGTVRVELVADRAAGLPLRVEVTDTGPGIKEAYCERLFTAFEQEDGSSTRAHDGAGIGLATAAGLVDLIGGRLRYEAVTGSGSRFTIDFPHVTLAAYPAAPTEQGKPN